jgi:hypothetical protein
MSESFFVGAYSFDVVEILETLSGAVAYREMNGTTSRCTRFAVEQLDAGSLVILGLGAVPALPPRWSLAVGTERVGGTSEPSSLLCLDPVYPAEIAPFNARLSLRYPQRRARQLHYVTPSAVLSLYCCHAIAIAPAGKAYE